MAATSIKEMELDVQQSTVFKTMNEFREQNLFCDVTLDINGTLFPCHRLILMGSSPYFKAMLNGNFKEASSKVIPIQDIDTEIMEIILHAIYTARLRLLPKNAYFVLKASHLLQFDVIFDACVNYIVKNVDHIHYLIETCLFAGAVVRQNLLDACIREIASAFLHWGKTDSFLLLPFDVLKHALSKNHSSSIYSDDIVIEIISKWCQHNSATSREARVLLQTPNFSSKIVGASAVAELIVAAESSFVSSENHDDGRENLSQSNHDLKLNVYLNAVDVKTGARGWATLMLNESFDKYELSKFQATDQSYREICSIGTKIYCMEFNHFLEKLMFSCFENDSTTELAVPELPLHDDGECQFPSNFRMTAVEDMIYMTYDDIDSPIWGYNCEVNAWQNDLFIQNESNVALEGYSSWYGLASLGHVLYVIGCKYYSSSGDRCILTIDTRSGVRDLIAFPNSLQHEHAAVCAFDGKIAISGSNHDDILHNTFSIFDVTAREWRTDLKPMNEGRANHELFHYGGFLYAVENNPFMKNEKYDLNLNTWIQIPNLPKRAQYVNADGVNVTVAFEDVLHVC
ncbi:kelch-like protein 17 [Planococcus citri]|uniref:kelch-like protein 17 n=1 Tax=Planococcus citri TaxID=170843 RepID=UPI0031F7FC9A